MDAFYASVEQRDNPDLQGQPVVVAWRGKRSVVCAASYEARPFGIHSAMPASRAERLCPQAIFVAPDFTRYRAVSRQVREIFSRYTDLIEPLSLDEAYLDVTSNKKSIATATGVARCIRADIKEETGLNASAGVAPNKFLAKIASDWRKPDGLFVIQPHEIEDFLVSLPVRKLPGVGKATENRLHDLDIETVGQLRMRTLAELQNRFGKFGRRLFNLSRGIDHNSVKPNRLRKSLSTETTFEDDRPIDDLGSVFEHLIEKLWGQFDPQGRQPQTIFIKLKTHDFRNFTRSHTPAMPPNAIEDLRAAVETLLRRLDLPGETRYRLAGVGLSNFRDRSNDPEQPELF